MNIKMSALVLVGGLALLGPALIPDVYGLPPHLAAAGQVVGTIAAIIGLGSLIYKLLERTLLFFVARRIDRGVRDDIADAKAEPDR